MSNNAGFPLVRPRRVRADEATRRLVREHQLTIDDLIYPVFVREGTGVHEAVASMPGVHRYSPDTLLTEYGFRQSSGMVSSSGGSFTLPYAELVDE